MSITRKRTSNEPASQHLRWSAVQERIPSPVTSATFMESGGISFYEKADAIEAEYDKLRLTEDDIVAFLRDAGISLEKQLARGRS